MTHTPKPAPRVMSRLAVAKSEAGVAWLERSSTSEATAEVNTLGTFTTVTMRPDGRGTFELRRRPSPGADSIVLATVEWNADDAEHGANLTGQAMLARGFAVEQTPAFDYGTNDRAF